MNDEPAFPRVGYETPTDGWKSGQEGMTLRDYFAGQALAGCMAYHNESSGDHHTNSNSLETAAFCYSLADAMLLERAK